MLSGRQAEAVRSPWSQIAREMSGLERVQADLRGTTPPMHKFHAYGLKSHKTEFWLMTKERNEKRNPRKERSRNKESSIQSINSTHILNPLWNYKYLAHTPSKPVRLKEL